MSPRPRPGPERERSVRREYARLASRYDERWAAYIEASVELTLRRLPRVVRPVNVLDVGCGTGALLAPLAVRFPFARLYGVDPSLPMLAAARARLPAGIALAGARAEALPFREAGFGLIASTSALHYFSDPAAAVAEMHRVLAPGGSVLITDWCGDYATVKLFELAMRAARRANFTLFDGRACERLLHEAGFVRVAVERERIGPLWGLMVVRAEKP